MHANIEVLLYTRVVRKYYSRAEIIIPVLHLYTYYYNIIEIYTFMYKHNRCVLYSDFIESNHDKTRDYSFTLDYLEVSCTKTSNPCLQINYFCICNHHHRNCIAHTYWTILKKYSIDWNETKHYYF